MFSRVAKSIAVITVLGAGAAFWFSLPTPLFEVPYSALLTDRDGRLLSARIAADGQWRFPPESEVPPRFAEAIIAFEDRRFHSHAGVDGLAVLRALWSNLDAGRVVSGASTLTMQVIRLARGSPPRTYGEKLVEALLALRLELTHSKAEILALYAGHAPFGGNVVGLEAAAWRYFGRAPAHLSWAEQATLAGLPNSPGLVHPARSRDALRERRDRLLRRLHLSGLMDETDLSLALREPLPARPRPLPERASALLDRLAAAEGPRAFHTTLDGRLQARVEGVVARHAARLKPAGIHNAALIVIDNETARIVAYVGNTGRPGMQQHGYAMDLVQAPRSTASVLKPLLYAAMLEKGELQPGALVPDIPLQFDGFRPENFDKTYRGAVPASLALTQSLNVPATVLLRRHGVAPFYGLLEKLGLRTLFRSAEAYGLSLILGGAEGTLFDLTTTYANLARVATEGQPRGVTELLRPTLLRERSPGKIGPSPIGAGAAWLTLQTLVDVHRSGEDSHWRNFASSRRVAWKTGTSYGLRDGWAIGTTPRHTVGVWAGNASGEGRAGLTGSSMAAPILFDVLGLVEAGGWFEKPVHQLKTIQVCAEDGYLPANGCARTTAEIPRDAHFNQVSQWHRWVHLDRGGQWRVHGGCESVGRMTRKSWFVLPPVREHFYARNNPGYRRLPPWRDDCVAGVAARSADFGIVYPDANSGLVIPTDFGGERGRVVLRAEHRDRDARLYWHMDGRLIATTRTFHEVAVDLDPGAHRLTLIDQAGDRQSRRFRVHPLGR